MKKTRIRNFIESIADVNVTFRKGGFYYDAPTETVNVDFSDIENDYGFIRNLKEVHKCRFVDRYSHLLWAILHEVGHYYTLDDYLDDEEEAGARLALACLTEEMVKDPEIQDMYYAIPSEWGATEWAIQFVRHNRSVCEHFDK